MGRARPTEDDEEMISGINVTPLVDITLVLLIIFMVTATHIARLAVEWEMPRAAKGGEQVGVMLAVVLTKEGELYVDGAKSDEAGLKAKAAAALAKDKDAKVIISADKAAYHGAVVRIIDLVKGSGISKFALNIDSELPGPAPAPSGAGPG